MVDGCARSVGLTLVTVGTATTCANWVKYVEAESRLRHTDTLAVSNVAGANWVLAELVFATSSAGNSTANLLPLTFTFMNDINACTMGRTFVAIRVLITAADRVEDLQAPLRTVCIDTFAVIEAAAVGLEITELLAVAGVSGTSTTRSGNVFARSAMGNTHTA